MYKKVVVKGMLVLCACQGLWGNVVTCEASEKVKEYKADDFNGEIRTELEKVKETGPIYTVSTDGSGSFTSVAEALERTSGNATFVIYPGVYEAYLDIVDREVNLIGTEKEKCILQADTKNYFYVPLNIAAGRFTNLTICGYNARSEEEYYTCLKLIEEFGKSKNLTESEAIARANMYPGYAIHIDNSFAKEHDIAFENCDIISGNSACVGIGSMPDSSITFTNCNFTNTGESGCIYFHNSARMDNDGNSYFNLIDCNLYVRNPDNAIFLESVCEDNVVYITSQNVKLYDLAAEEKKDVEICVVNEEKSENPEDLCGLVSFVLTGESYGNSITALNSK